MLRKVIFILRPRTGNRPVKPARPRLSGPRYATPHGSKYLQQLCKHFAHKIELTFDATSASVPLPPGNVTMTADAGELEVRIVAEDIKSMIHARFIIDSHLVPFAARENFTGLTWQMEEA